MRNCVQWLFVVLALFVCSCSEEKLNRKATYPITGEVHVDGQPAADLAVTFHNVNGMDTAEPTLTATRTDENGKFSASTYDAGDGAPEGEYSVTFEWNKLNTVSMSFDGDKLDGKYNDPKKSTFKIKVEDGKPADMGKIELTTK